MIREILTQRELKLLLRYDPETGYFFWLIKPAKQIAKGAIAGRGNRKNKYGYHRVRIFSVLYRQHQLAWLYVHGVWPEEDIDHINGNGLDNRIVNLRSVSHKENGKNCKLSKNSTTGINGVSFAKNCDKYYAYIDVDGERESLGYFAEKLDAICARKSTEYKYMFHKNHGSVR